MANDELKISVTGDKSGLEKLRQEVLKEIAIIKAQYKAASDDLKTMAKVEVATIQAASKEKIAARKSESTEKARMKKADEDAERSYQQYVREQNRQTAREIEQINKEIANRSKADAELQRRVSARMLQSGSTEKAGMKFEVGSIASLKETVRELKNFRDTLAPTDSRLKTTSSAIREMEREIRNLQGSTKRSGAQLLEMGENITVVLAGIKSVAGGIFNFGKTAITSAADFEELRGHFKGSESDIYNFQKATAFTVGKSDLIRLSNQANDLGIELSKQPMFFLLAKDAAEKYGTDLNTAFQSVVMATEGNVRGLKQIGIQKEVYKQIVSELTQSMGGEIETTTALNGEQEINIKNLDPLVQKNIRFEAILKATGVTMDDVNKKTQSNADKLAQLDLLIPQVKKQFGELLADGIIPITDALKDSEGKFNKATVAVTGLTLSMGELIPAMAGLKYISGPLFAAVGVWAGAIAGLAAQIFIAKNAWDELKLAFTGEWRRTLGGKLYGLDQTDSEQNSKNEVGIYEGIKNRLKQLSDFRKKVSSIMPKDINDTKIPKGSTGTGKAPGTEQGSDSDIDEIVKLEKELKEIHNSRVALVKKYGVASGIVLDTDKKILEIEQRIDYLRTGAHAPKKLDMTFPEFELLPYASTKSAFEMIVEQSKPMTDALVQQSEIYRESWSNTISSITGNLGTLFGALANGGDSGEAFKGFMKGIVGTFITSIQAMLIASNAALLAKGITSFGITLLTDAPMLAAGWLALEAAKGFIGALEKGGPFGKAGTYLVGEAGPELVRFNRPGRVYNNSETKAMLRPVQNNNSVKNIVTVKANNSLLRELIEVTIDEINGRNSQLAY